MTEQEILSTSQDRIEKVRKSNVTITVVTEDGRTVDGATVSVEQTRHSFLFGCNVFPMRTLEGEKREVFGSHFSSLLNYATLPFYWGFYEPEPGRTIADSLVALAEWCREHGITTKGHPLVWHEVYPSWAPSGVDETRAMEQARVSDIIPRFAGLIDIWDVVNEATVSTKYDNGVGNWAKRDGEFALVAESLDWARAAGPNATLLYNDYNVSPEYEKLAAELVEARKPVDIFGIQSHMHGGEWPIEKAWYVCETYSKFGKPLHFTELTVISGDHGWAKETPWSTTPEGEARQAEYVEKLYRVLFSHPAVQAITWWDFDDGQWMGAPAGLIRADFSTKPAYDQLMQLVKNEWWTRVSGETTEGRFSCRGFLGAYTVTATVDGKTKTQEFDLNPGPNEWTVRM